MTILHCGLAAHLPLLLLRTPKLKELHLNPVSAASLDVVFLHLQGLPCLSSLSLVDCDFRLPSRTLAALGSLPLSSIAVEARWPTASRNMHDKSGYSHLTDKAVVRLVDGACQREAYSLSSPIPLKLSLRGATALTRTAVAALMRLPLLIELDITGCCSITSMEKLRLMSKVRLILPLNAHALYTHTHTHLTPNRNAK
jgi:hypothetical protein